MTKNTFEFEDLEAVESSVTPLRTPGAHEESATASSDGNLQVEGEATKKHNPRQPAAQAVPPSNNTRAIAKKVTGYLAVFCVAVGGTHFAAEMKAKESARLGMGLTSAASKPLPEPSVKEIATTPRALPEFLANVISTTPRTQQRSSVAFDSSSIAKNGFNAGTPFNGGMSQEVSVNNTDWTLNQLNAKSIDQEKRVLQLEAQVAMLHLDLTKQKSESYAAMEAATEAGKAVLAVSQGLKSMKAKVGVLSNAVNNNGKAIAGLEDRLSSAYHHVNARVSNIKSSQKTGQPSVSHSAVPSSRESISDRSKPAIKQLHTFDPVMVTERGAFVRNLVTEERRVLELGKKYNDIGRVTSVDPQKMVVHGVSISGTRWVIRKVVE